MELGLTGDWQHMIDSTTVRGHLQAAGAKGGLIRKLFGRSRGGFTTKIHTRADGQGRPLGFILTGGASNYKAVPQRLAIPLSRPCKMLADKGYDADAIREELLLHGTRPVMPSRSPRKRSLPCDYVA